MPDPDLPDDPAEALERVVDAVGARFPAHEPMVQAVADSLTWGEGADGLTQARIQDWLWVTLPRHWDESEWQAAVIAAGLLFDGLGKLRYAAIARSPTTAGVLDAWRVGRSRGYRAYEAAKKVSGVRPPDTDLLSWGSIFGPVELNAFARVEWALEGAIVAGDLRPGQPRWPSVAQGLCEQVLRETATPRDLGAAPGELVPAVPEGSPVSVVELVLRERIGQWVRLASREPLSTWRSAVAGQLLLPPEDPAAEAIGDRMAPMRWLLEACRDGVTLTQSGYLPVRLMRDGVERFGWWDWRVPPRSEADVYRLAALRSVAMRARFLARRGQRLTTARSAVRLLGDAVGMWRAVAGVVGGSSAFDATVSELVALRLLAGPAVGDTLPAELAPVLDGLGWRADRGPMDERATRGSVSEVLGEWRLFGFLDEVRPPWDGPRPTGPNVTSLSALGRISALRLLHVRATRPRADLLG